MCDPSLNKCNAGHLGVKSEFLSVRWTFRWVNLPKFCQIPRPSSDPIYKKIFRFISVFETLPDSSFFFEKIRNASFKQRNSFSIIRFENKRNWILSKKTFAKFNQQSIVPYRFRLLYDEQKKRGFRHLCGFSKNRDKITLWSSQNPPFQSFRGSGNFGLSFGSLDTGMDTNCFFLLKRFSGRKEYKLYYITHVLLPKIFIVFFLKKLLRNFPKILFLKIFLSNFVKKILKHLNASNSSGGQISPTVSLSS